MSGDADRAQAAIDESISVAEALGQRYELTLSREARGRLGEALGWKDTFERERAEMDLKAIRGALASEMREATRPESEPQTLSLVDRFATLLHSGRSLATALTTTAVYAELKQASLALLRAERCVVLEVQATDDKLAITPVHGSAGLPTSRDLIREATSARRAVARSGGDLDPELRGARIRSALCVPIVVRSSVWGCLYVIHGEVDGLFGEEEIRIGEFLATLAGAALENAQGFSQIQSFSRVLEVRVDQRTAELARANHDLEENLRRLRETQEQLLQAGKMAAIGTLVAGLSHELNNPLGVILGYVNTLLEQLPEDAKARRPLAAIERQTERCVRLVRALLDFSRTKASVREPTRLSTICENVLQLVSSTMTTRSLRLDTHIQADARVELVVCPQEIESALLNLLANAIDASLAGGRVELTVSPSTVGQAPGIEFSVCDEGTGIPATIVSRIFDPFFTTKPEGQGTGLGLSLTRRIVEAHNGRIDVDSAEGRGTRMMMWLPLAGGSEPMQSSDAQVGSRHER
jgi:signal transduction histidine kinase